MNERNEFYIVPPSEGEQRGWLLLHTETHARFHETASNNCALGNGERPFVTEDSYIGYLMEPDALYGMGRYLRMSGCVQVESQ